MKKFRYLFIVALSFLLVPAFCLGQDSGFALLDTDSDGELTVKELKEYTKKILPGFQYLDKFADRVDVDKDGKISEEELKGSKKILQALSREVNGGTKKKELSKAELKLVDEATKAYGEISELISKGDWKETAAKMTEQASDDYVMELIMKSIAITDMNLPPQLDTPAVNDAKDATIDVIDKYKLDDIDISSIRRSRGRPGQPNDDDDDDDDDTDQTPEEKAKSRRDKVRGEMDKVKAKIRTTIDKDKQRWEIIAALHKAQKGSPFESGVFSGKIGESDVVDNVVFLTVTRTVPGRKVALPTVLKMTANKGDWKYAGIDPERTGKAIRRMIQGLNRGGAPDEPDTDF